MYDIQKIRADFPILSREVNGKPLVYLDNGASAQKPRVVIDAMTQMYEEDYANVHRGLHTLSTIATEKYEGVRGIVARFLNAGSEDEIVFTTGSTEGINLVSYAWAAPRLQAGDEIVLSVLEHHANIVPWHFLRERQGVVLKWVEPEADGSLPAAKVLEAIGPKTKLIAVTHMSNVLGTLVDVKTICAGAREKGVPVLVDGLAADGASARSAQQSRGTSTLKPDCTASTTVARTQPEVVAPVTITVSTPAPVKSPARLVP